VAIIETEKRIEAELRAEIAEKNTIYLSLVSAEGLYLHC
jgi:hypothetical protein